MCVLIYERIHADALPRTSEDDIRHAVHRLARKLHPDMRSRRADGQQADGTGYDVGVENTVSDPSVSTSNHKPHTTIENRGITWIGGYVLSDTFTSCFMAFVGAMWRTLNFRMTERGMVHILFTVHMPL